MQTNNAEKSDFRCSTNSDQQIGTWKQAPVGVHHTIPEQVPPAKPPKGRASPPRQRSAGQTRL